MEEYININNSNKIKNDNSMKKQPLLYFLFALIFATTAMIFVTYWNQIKKQKNQMNMSMNINAGSLQDQNFNNSNSSYESNLKINRNNIRLSTELFSLQQIQKELRQLQSISFSRSPTTSTSLKIYKAYIKYKNGQQKTRILADTNPNTLQSYIQQIQQNISTDQKCKFYMKDNHYTYYDAIGDAIGLFTPFLGIALTYYIFTRMSPDRIMSKMMPNNKKSFKVQSMKNINVKFSDVAGMQQAKQQITQFVDFLKKGQKYLEMGAKIPKGALLTGPPGTGKTMLAKACAGQAGVNFFYISGSQFVQVFVGVGASKVRDLFAKARQQAPSIIFIDQIDAIGKKRQNSRNEQKDQTLNQLLVQMDGFSSNQTVIVMAASNRKQVLDNALTRPGRFDRMIQVTLPDIQGRQQIFKVHLKPLKIDPHKQLSDIAKRLSQLSPGFSGADIANLCNQAAIIAARKNQPYIVQKDFQEAAQRVTAGYQKKSMVTVKTKKRVAFHQAGHAVAGWFLRGGDPLVKLTIIPRSKGALGYAQYLPKSTNMKTKQQLIDRVAIMLGGITSQEIFYGNFSSGGSDDLQKVYSLTRAMIMQYGMGLSTYNLTMDEQTYVRKQSQYLSDIMQEQVSNILNIARLRSKEILLAKKQIVENLANALVQKQTINQQEIKLIMGDRPNFQDIDIKGKEEGERQAQQAK